MNRLFMKMDGKTRKNVMTEREAIEYGKNKILRAEEKIQNSNDYAFISLLQEGIGFCKTSLSGGSFVDLSCL